MESGGMIRCSQCGYKNSPVYHYCGVCGAVLQSAEKAEPAPKAVAVPPARPAVPPLSPSTPASAAPAPMPAPIPAPPPLSNAAPRPTRSEPPAASSGMSFLGLNEAPRSGADYLLDEEEQAERSAHWGRILVVLVVLGVIGGLGWQWYRGGYPFTRPVSQANNAVVPAAAPAPNPAASAPSASPAPETPAEASQPPAEAPAPATRSAETTPQAAATQETPKEGEAAAPAPVEKSAPAETTLPATAPQKTPHARVKPPAAAPETPVVPGEAFFVQGQRYLYGTGGVQANCDLALRSLSAAAAKSHPRAQSTLGTMYSTGHCVNRDLPTAYRWFAKALHQDPNNSRLEEDLSVVWRQMTPGEQQTAMRKE